MAKRVISAILTLKDRNFSSGVKKAAKEMTDFERKVQRTKNNINDFGRKSAATFKNIGVAAAGLGATAFTAFGTAIVSTFTEMETAFSQLEAKTGATGKKLEGLQNVAKDVFTAGFGENIAMVTNDVATLSAMFSDLNDKQLTDLAIGASTIAELWGAETKEVARAVQAMTNNFDGLSETKALDLITTAFQRTGDLSNDLLDTFSEYSMHFDKLGLSAEEFAGILVRAGENGVFSLDFAADAVKELGIRVIDESKTTAEGFKAIGFDAEEMANKFAQGGEVANCAFQATIAGLAAMKNPIERNAAGVALWGTKWEDIREDVILAMGDSASAIEGFEGATARASESIHDNFGAKMQQVWRELKVGISDAFANAGGKKLLDDFSNKAQDFIPVIEKMATGAVNFGNAFKDNWPVIKEMIVGVGTFVGVLGAIKGVMALVTAAQWLWNAAMMANPITWVVLGVAALVAIGVTLYRNFDIIKQKASELWQRLVDNPLLALVSGPIGALIAAGIAIYKNWDTIKLAAGALWTTIQEKFAGIKEAVSNAVQPIIGWFTSLKDKWDSFKNAISNFKLPDWVSKLGGGAVGWVMEKVKGSFAVGTNSVPHDMVAQIHKGEMIIPARQAQRLREQGVTIDNIDRVASTNTVTTNNTKSSNNINININAQNMTTSQVVKELVPQLKLALANM